MLSDISIPNLRNHDPRRDDCYYPPPLGKGGYTTVNSSLVHFKSKSGGIPAMSSLTMGSASCDLFGCSGSGVLFDSGSDITVYNDASAFPANSYGVAVKNEADLYVIVRGIFNLRINGNDLQLSFDGITWVTWATGTNCPS